MVDSTVAGSVVDEPAVIAKPLSCPDCTPTGVELDARSARPGFTPPRYPPEGRGTGVSTMRHRASALVASMRQPPDTVSGHAREAGSKNQKHGHGCLRQ